VEGLGANHSDVQRRSFELFACFVLANLRGRHKASESKRLTLPLGAPSIPRAPSFLLSSGFSEGYEVVIQLSDCHRRQKFAMARPIDCNATRVVAILPFLEALIDAALSPVIPVAD
jgi:hypothetical protein